MLSRDAVGRDARPPEMDGIIAANIWSLTEGFGPSDVEDAYESSGFDLLETMISAGAGLDSRPQ
jgi:hypothetical protein